jgi:hypothetical protein
LRGEILILDDSYQRKLASLDAEMNFPISLSDYIQRSRYEHFLLGADNAAFTLDPYNLAYFAVFLIPDMHYNTLLLIFRISIARE